MATPRSTEQLAKEYDETLLAQGQARMAARDAETAHKGARKELLGRMQAKRLTRIVVGKYLYQRVTDPIGNDPDRLARYEIQEP